MNKSEMIPAIIYATIIVATTALIMFILLFQNSIVVDELSHTTTYENITVTNAKILVESKTNITIADCTGGCQPCSWKNGNIPGATWVENYETLYNSTNTLLIYTKDGLGSEEICKLLVGHVYGDIYNLVGGYNMWVN